MVTVVNAVGSVGDGRDGQHRDLATCRGRPRARAIAVSARSRSVTGPESFISIARPLSSPTTVMVLRPSRRMSATVPSGVTETSRVPGSSCGSSEMATFFVTSGGRSEIDDGDAVLRHRVGRSAVLAKPTAYRPVTHGEDRGDVPVEIDDREILEALGLAARSRRLCASAPRDREVTVARERERVGACCASANVFAVMTEWRSCVRSVASSERTLSTSVVSPVRARDRRQVRGSVACFDGPHLERRRVDVRDASALRVRDPYVFSGRDRRSISRLDLLLRRRWRRSGVDRRRRRSRIGDGASVDRRIELAHSVGTHRRRTQ